MGEIEEIRTRGSLRAWLEKQPHEVSVWMAFRAAARVLPIWWQAVLRENWAVKNDLTPLPVLRNLLISQVATVTPTEDIKIIADAAADVGIVGVPFTAANEAEGAARGAVSVVAGNNHGARLASLAAYNSTRAASDSSALAWHAIRTDAAEAEDGPIPVDIPLWPHRARPLAEQWTQIKAHVATSPEVVDWQFWIDWYEAVLKGRIMLPDPVLSWEMLEKIVIEVRPETWDSGPENANPEIRKIWESYKGTGAPELDVLQAADDGIVLNYNSETDRLYQEDIAAERPVRLQSAVAKLNEVRLLVGQMGNLQGVLTSEMFLIDRAVQDHPENATMVFFNAKTARGLLLANIENGSCPPPDSEPVIGLLDTMLLDTQNTLLPETSVQDGLKDRAEDSGLLDAPDALATLEGAAEEIAEVSEGALAKELPENIEKAKDPYQPRAVRMAALVSTVSALVQSWVIAGYARFKTTLSELDDITARTARISKNIVLIGGTGGVGYGALQVVTNSAKVEAAIKAIIALF